MADVSLLQWLMLLGVGSMWLGVQIAVVSGGPRMFQRAAPPLATTVQFEHLFGCFAVMMDTAKLLHTLLSKSEEQSPFLEDALHLAGSSPGHLT